VNIADLIIVLASGSRPTEGHDACARCTAKTCNPCPLKARG
jgi:hypothetical protein